LPQKLTRIELLSNHSEEVQEVIGQTPKGMVRWGTSFFILILLSIGLVCFFVKYSDILNGQFVLTAANAPKSVIAKKDGKLQALFAKEKDSVQEGQVLAYLESNALHADVIRLSAELEKIWLCISNDKWEDILEYRPAAFQKLGELQSSYQTFIAVYIQLHAYLKEGMYVQKKKLLQQELLNLADMGTNLQEQEKLYNRDYAIATEDFKAKDELYAEKVIPLLEYKQEESKMLGKKLPLDNIQSGIISNNTAISNKRQELIELDQQFADQKSNFLQALNTLISNTDDWKKNFLLIAPVSGRVTWPMLLQEKQDVKTGQELFYISPANASYLGEIYVSQESFGKLHLGQNVLISLAGYPYQEFGKLHGKVSFISNFPVTDLASKEKRFYVAISLENGLQTDLGRWIEFRNGLSGTAEIITGKSRLINKFLYTIRKIVDQPVKKESSENLIK
jgi:multidrug resistance efflux pump